MSDYNDEDDHFPDAAEDEFDDESSDDEGQGIIADEPNKFETLCDGVLNTIAILHQSLKEFLEVKDILVQHHLPPSVVLSLGLTSSKVFRSVTDMHEPLHELVRMVRIYSTPWEEKSAALKKLHDDFRKKTRQLDVAVRRLNLIDAMSKKIAYERKILNWEKLYCKVTSAKGHGRRWKFTIDRIKQQAKQGYDVLVRQVDQVEDSYEPYPETEQVRVESQVPQMDTIAEEGEDGSRIDERIRERTSQTLTLVSGGESVASDDLEESIEPETLKTPSEAMAQVSMDKLKPETSDIEQCTHLPDYDITLYVRCYCPKGIEGRDIKCSFTHGSQYEKTSRLDLTDEEIAEEVAKAPPPKPKGPMRRGAPPPPPEPAISMKINVPVAPVDKHGWFSELRFPLPVTQVGRKEIPPTIKSLTVSVHEGDNEDIIAMGTIEVDDIVGCEMPEIYELPDSFGAELSIQDAVMYTQNSSVDSALQLMEPLPVSFPVYPLGGGRAGTEIKACGSVPLFFFYKKVYKPKALSRAIGTGNVRELILEELGVDIFEQNRETLFPQRADIAISPMTAVSTPPPRTPADNVIPLEEFDEVVQVHQREMQLMQNTYESQMEIMRQQMESLQNQLNNQQATEVIYQQRPASTDDRPRQFVFKKEKREPKKIAINKGLPRWGEGLPDDFFERMDMYKEESEANKRIIAEHIRREQSDSIEKKLAFQHKAFRGSNADIVDALKDVTLPALYNKNIGSNVYNPRVGQYFHATGSNGLRLTQPPSMLNLPPLKNKASVVNLFDLGQSIHNPNELLQKYMVMRQAGTESANIRSTAPVNTADGRPREHPASAAERLESTGRDVED